MRGAEALVRHLAEHNIPIAVGTSSSLHYFHAKTSNHRAWFELFKDVVTADHAEVTVGARRICSSLRRHLGVDPRDCIVFEDSPFGVTAARLQGCTPWPCRTRTCRSSNTHTPT